jgi:hypothetical protein
MRKVVTGFQHCLQHALPGRHFDLNAQGLDTNRCGTLGFFLEKTKHVVNQPLAMPNFKNRFPCLKTQHARVQKQKSQPVRDAVGSIGRRLLFSRKTPSRR